MSAGIVFMAAGCPKSPEPVTPPQAPQAAQPAAPSAQWPGSDEDHVLYKALVVRDPEPRCDTVSALVPDPVTSLTFLAEQIANPPWVGMRAGACLAKTHAADAQDTLRAWVVDPKLKGLALQTLLLVDQIPEDVAVAVVTDALAGPHTEAAAKAVSTSSHEAVRALK